MQFEEDYMLRNDVINPNHPFSRDMSQTIKMPAHEKGPYINGYYSICRLSVKCSEQTARICKLTWTFVVSELHKGRFRALGSINLKF